VPLPASDDDGDGFIERFHRGDAAAWQCAAGWATAAIRRLKFAISREDVEDLAWRTIEEVWSNVTNGKQIHQPRAFICHVARCRTLSWLRQRRPRVDLNESFPDPGPDPCMEAVLNDQRSLMRIVLQQLGPDEHELLRLRISEEMSYREIASQLDRTENYWRSQMCELVAKIRRLMTPKPRPPETR
jgi:RNA polymerase sigma factor (sigma-70 family)